MSDAIQLPAPQLYTWIYKSGRDGDGDKFSTEICVHGSGRILARVVCPLGENYYHSAFFYCDIPTSIMPKCDDGARFIDLESAKAFVEDVLARNAEKVDRKKGKK